ncbi:MAG: pyridoxamine 5'-phosphate oxidase [Myxococcota bacterium]|nr:pyridoxamine 5'-phosphate oxidase [Myxococcota bacterium]
MLELEEISITSPPEPFVLFDNWFDAAAKLEMAYAESMAVCSVDPQGRPSIRMVLLKDYSEDGFIFYTNLNSRKSKNLLNNPNTALLFYWESLERQIRIEGVVLPVDSDVADGYFRSRGRLSQAGARASKQSEFLPNRAELLARVDRVTHEFEGREIPRPDHWSGFLVQPRSIEFWQSKPNRLHERVVFERDDCFSPWRAQRLYP